MLYTTGHFCKWLFFDWLIDWLIDHEVAGLTAASAAGKVTVGLAMHHSKGHEHPTNAPPCVRNGTLCVTLPIEKQQCLLLLL